MGKLIWAILSVVGQAIKTFLVGVSQVIENLFRGKADLVL
jgi:hypothetical protein